MLIMVETGQAWQQQSVCDDLNSHKSTVWGETMFTTSFIIQIGNRHVVTTVSDKHWNRKPGNVSASVAVVTELDWRWSLLGNLPSRKLVSRRESKETDHFWFAFQSASAEKMVAILRQEQLVSRFTLRSCFSWWTVLSKLSNPNEESGHRITLCFFTI